MGLSKRLGVGFALIVGLGALGSQRLRARVTEAGADNDALLEALNENFAPSTSAPWPTRLPTRVQ